MAVAEYQVTLTGRPQGPAFNNWYFTNASGLGGLFTTDQVDSTQVALAQFYDLISDAMAGTTVANFDPVVKMIDVASGQALSVVTGTVSTPPVSGSSVASGTALHSHVKLQTRTGVYENGRELRGGCFIGPTGDEAIASSGMLSSSVKEAVSTAGQTLLTALGNDGIFLNVWRRPRRNHPTLPDRDGSIAIVSGIQAWDQIAVLRSRRD